MNQSGFTSISLIIFTPLIFSLLFGSFWLIWFLNQKHHLNNICHQSLLESQQRLVSGNKRLLALNSLAYAYIFEKKVLEMIIIGGPPPAKIAARIRRRIVIQQQRALARSQKSILKIASYTSKSALFELRRKFHSKIKKIKTYWKSNQEKHPSITIFAKESQVKVRIKDIAPVYERRPDHSQTQAMQAQWRVPLRSLLPVWLKEIVRVHEIWEGKCNSHPHKGDYQWHPAIGAGKHS